MIPSFPTVLPRPRIEYSVERRATMLRSQYEGCEAVQRKQSNKAPRTAKLTWLFTDRQNAIFGMFVELNQNHGAMKMRIPLQLGELSYDETYVVQLVSSAITSVREHPYWLVTASVEIPETKCLSLDDYEFNIILGAGGAERVQEAVDLFHRVVHVKLPPLSQTPIPTLP